MEDDEKREITNQLVVANAILEAVQLVVHGQEVDDFMQSFSPVRDVMELVDEIKNLEALLREG